MHVPYNKVITHLGEFFRFSNRRLNTFREKDFNWAL